MWLVPMDMALPPNPVNCILIKYKKINFNDILTLNNFKSINRSKKGEKDWY